MYTVLWQEAGQDRWDRLETKEEVSELLRKLEKDLDVYEGDVWVFKPEANEYAVEFDSWEFEIDIKAVKDYLETINLDDYDLGGVEITEEDYETILKRVNDGNGTLEEVVDDYFFEIREVLDMGLDDEEDLVFEKEHVENNISSLKKAVNILWDVTDGAEDMTQEEIDDLLETLPTEIEIPDGMDDLDEIADYLSDVTGFLHYGFTLAEMDSAKECGNAKETLADKIQSASEKAVKQAVNQAEKPELER